MTARDVIQHELRYVSSMPDKAADAILSALSDAGYEIARLERQVHGGYYNPATDEPLYRALPDPPEEEAP